MRRLVLVLTVFVAMTAGLLPAHAAALWKVSGTVTVPAGVDATTVTVGLGPPDGSTTFQVTKPSSGGAYVFSSVAYGTYRLTFSGPGLQSATLAATVTFADLTGMDVTLVRLVKLSGQITGPGPVTSIVWLHFWDVACTAEAFSQAVSPTAGTYETMAFPGGVYKVQVVPAGGQGLPTWYDRRAACTDAQPVDATDSRSLDLAVRNGGQISGRVTHGGQPVGGRSMSLFREQPSGSGTWARLGQAAQTAADGTYAFSGLEGGRYKVFTDTEWAANTLAQWSGVVDINGEQASGGVDLSLEDAGRISGRITGPSGPRANVSVRAMDAVTNEWITGTASASDGTWTITGLDPGDYTVLFNDADGSNQEYYDNVKSFRNAQVFHIDAGSLHADVDAWIGSDDPGVDSVTPTFTRPPKRLKVRKVVRLARTSGQGAALTWRTTSPKKCRVLHRTSAWKLKGLRKGTCRLRVAVSSPAWTSKLTVRVV